MSARAHVWVSGRVQGIFFRATTRRVAKRLGLTGWVKNLRDGRVEAVFEGPRDKIDEALRFCHQGPPAAIVKNVEVKWEDTAGKFDDFDIVF